MTWNDLETIFNRSLRFSLIRKKLLFTFPILIFCGLIIVCFRALGAKSNDWLAVSMTFLPIFFSSIILLMFGILLTRIYYNEVKAAPVSYRKILLESKNLMIEVAYLVIPAILVYFLLWIALGIFYLLKEIPVIGSTLGVILSFGPFLLLLASYLLNLANLALLFFVTPAAAFKSSAQMEILQGIIKRFKMSPFSNIALLLLALLPLILVAGLMTFAAMATGNQYLSAEDPFAIGVEWFFIMLPFSALLSPAVIFFFNFSAESHVFMVKKMKEAECESPS